MFCLIRCRGALYVDASSKAFVLIQSYLTCRRTGDTVDTNKKSNFLQIMNSLVRLEVDGLLCSMILSLETNVKSKVSYLTS